MAVIPALVGPESMNNQSCPPGHGGKFLFFPNYLIKHLNRMLMLCESDKCLSVLKDARSAASFSCLFASFCLFLCPTSDTDSLIYRTGPCRGNRHQKKPLLQTCLCKCLYYDLQPFFAVKSFYFSWQLLFSLVVKWKKEVIWQISQ